MGGVLDVESRIGKLKADRAEVNVGFAERFIQQTCGVIGLKRIGIERQASRDGIDRLSVQTHQKQGYGIHEGRGKVLQECEVMFLLLVLFGRFR